MRDRRNTNLSTSSTLSSSSDLPFSTPACEELHEKRCEDWLAEEEGLLSTPSEFSEEKEKKPKQASGSAMAIKMLAVLVTVILLLRYLLTSSLRWPEVHTSSSIRPTRLTPFKAESSNVIVVDHSGRPKWTVSIPHNASFPLPPQQYRDMCARSDILREELKHGSRLSRPLHWHSKSDYLAADPAYLDIAEAISAGLLPHQSVTQDAETCNSSLTFSMETDDASFGKTLLMLWMSYGLAKQEGRAFFIDDSRWPYGKYSTYFAPPPTPNCKPSPPSHIVPCPHSARHIIVSAATAPWTFGATFDHAFLQPGHTILQKRQQVHSLLRSGYEALFQLIGDDAAYASARIASMSEASLTTGDPIVAMQMRRGDLHPSEFQFSRDYLPFERYTTAAKRMLDSLRTNNKGTTTTTHNPHLLLASDDPNILTSPDLMDASAPLSIVPAQERIQLATKAALDKSSPAIPYRQPGSAYTKHVDENAGWDGGFYAATFMSLGSTYRQSQQQRLSPAQPQQPSEQALGVRELVGRAYLLDLAVLSRGDGVVCAVSSAGCRLLGVMMGWEAVGNGRWANVDDGRAWSWDGRR